MVPSSIVQDPGIKGALFQDDCHQLFVARNAGLCASPSRCTDSAEVFSKGPVDTGFFEHLEDGAWTFAAFLQRHRKVDLEDVRAGSSAIAGGGGKDAHARFSGLLAELVLTPVLVLLRLQVRVVESLD